MNNIAGTIDTIQAAWRRKAYAQGILCMICCEPPKFENREKFYDTGVCEVCDKEIVAKTPLRAS